jgi:hypothetical protein
MSGIPPKIAKEKTSPWLRLPPALPRLMAAFGIFFVISGLIGLLYLQQPLRDESFDVRRDAAVPDGPVLINSPQANSTFNLVKDEQATIHLQAHTNNVAVGSLKLVFQIKTEVFEARHLEIQVAPESRLGLVIESQEVERVTNGFLVSTLLRPISPQVPFLTNDWRNILLVSFKAQNSGNIAFIFDQEKSVAYPHLLTVLQDEMRIIPDMNFAVAIQTAGASPSPTPSPTPGATPGATPSTLDDLFFDQNLTTIEFFTADESRTPTAGTGLDPNRNYVARVRYTVQNNHKNNDPDTRVLAVSFRINGSQTALKNYYYSQVTNHQGGLTDVVEGVFSPLAPTNIFQLVVDPQNFIPELNTNNNTWERSFTRQTNIGGSSQTPDSYQQCNQACSSNNDCEVNFRCFTGVCRLATNPSSTTCSPETTKSVSYIYDDQKGSALASPDPSATGSAEASPSPTASPSPSPTSSPEPIDDASDELGWLDFLRQVLGGPEASLQRTVISLGTGLVMLALLFSGAKAVFGGKRRRTAASPSPAPSPAPLPTALTGQSPTTTFIAPRPIAPSSGTIQHPTEIGRSPMLDRIKEKGIVPPEKQQK